MNTSGNSNTIADDKNRSVSRDNLNDGTCKRVYVSNLPYNFCWQKLKNLFSQVGTVDFVKIFNDENNKSMGSGIVDFNDPGGADKAVQTMNGHNINGRELLVKLYEGDDCDRHGRVVRGSCEGGSDDNAKGRQKMRNSLVNLFYYRKILTSLFWWNSSNSLPGFFHTHCDAR